MTVMRQLRDFKKVAGQAAHELAGAVAVVKFVAEGLHVPEQIPPDVRLDTDAEGVTPVADDEVEKAADQIGRAQDAHDEEEGLIGARREHLVDGAAREQREDQIDQRGHGGAEDVQHEQPHMRPEVGQEDPCQTMLAVILCVFHRLLPFVRCSGSRPPCGSGSGR